MPPSPTPPRLLHLLPIPVLVEQLAPSYAVAHQRLPEEVYDEVKSGLEESRLREPWCDEVWRALKAARPTLSDDELLEKVAAAMAKKGGPRPREAPTALAEKLSTLFAIIDVNVGRAGDTARAALETERGQAMLKKSLAAAGEYLAQRLLDHVKSPKDKAAR